MKSFKILLLSIFVGLFYMCSSPEETTYDKEWQFKTATFLYEQVGDIQYPENATFRDSLLIEGKTFGYCYTLINPSFNYDENEYSSVIDEIIYTHNREKFNTLIIVFAGLSLLILLYSIVAEAVNKTRASFLNKSITVFAGIMLLGAGLYLVESKKIPNHDVIREKSIIQYFYHNSS